MAEAKSDKANGATPAMDEKELFAAFCKSKAVNNTHWALNVLFGVVPVVLGISVYVAIWCRLLPSPTKEVQMPSIIQRAIPGFFLSILLERLLVLAKGKPWYRLNDAVNSITMGAFEQAFSQLFLSSLKIVPYLWVNHNFALVEWSEGEVTWTAWWGMFVCVELGYYWLHRFHHEWNLLWAGHNVHHSSEEYNLTTALRQSPIQTVFSWIFYLPFAFFFPFELFAFHNQFWIHTRVIGRLPWPLEFVLNTPSHHRVHHGQNRKCIDKNYGGTLIIFDRLFGTFIDESEIGGEVVYGINHMPNSWDLAEVQIKKLKECWEISKITPVWWIKLRVFLDLGPYYNWWVYNWETRFKPSIANKPRLAPVSVDTYVKYDVDACNKRIGYYALTQTIIVSVLPLLDQSVKWTWGFYFIRVFTIFNLWALTRFWQPTPKMELVEGVRLLSLLAVFIWQLSLPKEFLPYVILFHVVSYCWVLFNYSPIPATTKKEKTH